MYLGCQFTLVYVTKLSAQISSHPSYWLGGALGTRRFYAYYRRRKVNSNPFTTVTCMCDIVTQILWDDQATLIRFKTHSMK